MAITLDTIVNKVFKVVKNGYDNNEVESFLDEILEEMENREAETNKLKEQVAQLTAELNQARADLQKEQSSKPEIACADCRRAAPHRMNRHLARALMLVSAKRRAAMKKLSPLPILALPRLSTKRIRMRLPSVRMRRQRLPI